MDFQEFSKKINDAKEPEVAYREIDWGNSMRWQGKRSGGMVRGAMSADIRGIRKYPYIVINIPDYDTVKDDLKALSFDRVEMRRYQKARNAEFNHRIAAIYAIKGTIEETYKVITKLKLL